MRFLRRAARRLRALVMRRRLDRELREEIALHLALEAEQLERDGLSPEDARLAARRAFGGVERWREETRDARGVRTVEELGRDVRFGTRALRARPSTTLLAILTLALGIGGTTAVYGAVHHVLLAPLPYRDAERVVTLWQQERTAGAERDGMSPANFLDLKERSRSFATLAAADPYSFDHVGPDGPERFRSSLVSEGFFDALGVTPAIGRGFRAEEHRSGSDAVVLLAHATWRERFGADTAIVGRTLVLDSVARTVIGVMPPGVDLPFGDQMWAPKVFSDAERQSRASAYFAAVGRLRDGVSPDAARRELTALAAALEREHPHTNAGVGVQLVPLGEQLLGEARGALLVLLGAVTLVLLIACVNVANLQLARTMEREREFAMRLALGASRGRLARQLLTESLLLAIAGGTLGIAIAHAATGAIRALAPVELPRVELLRVDVPVLLFALAASALTAVLFALAPLAFLLRGDLRAGAAAAGRGIAGPGRGTLRGTLVAAECALALVLLVGAGLLLRSFELLTSEHRGFRPDGVLAVTVQAWSYYPTPQQRADFVRTASERLASLPGVRRVGMASSLPFHAPIGQEHSGVQPEGAADAGTRERVTARVAAATAGFFETLEIPLRDGRLMNDGDRAGTLPVVVVNEAFARRFWPGERAVGRRVSLAFSGPPVMREVIGIVGDVRHTGLHEPPQPTAFLPHAQAPTGAVHLVVRTRGGEARELLPAVRRELRAMNGVMPLSDVSTLETLVRESLRARRFHLALLAAFATVALVLATVGVYGVTAQATRERTRELGVRMALGARSGDVLLIVARQGLALALAGMAVGAVGAATGSRTLRGMLYSVGPLDPLAFAAAAAVLVVATVLACWIPARRASRLDPAAVLRAD